MPRDIKHLVRDGILHSGLFFLLFASLLVPFIHLLVFWILPLPFLLLRVRQSSFAMAIPAILSGLLLGLFPHPVFAFFFLFSWVVGWTMGSVWRRQRTTGTDVVLAGWAAGTLSVLIFLAAGQAWLGWFDLLESRLTLAVDEAAGMLTPEGMGAAEAQIRVLAPVMILGMTLLISLATFSAAKKRLKTAAGKSLPAFHAWRCPKAFFHGFWLAWLIRVMAESPEVRETAASALTVFELVFAVQGLAFIAYSLNRHEASRGWLIPAVLLAFTPLIDLLVILGLLDTATGIRERLRGKK